jgi:lambda family phage tail tape measure protein
MASQNIARLGVVLAMDTAEFTASVDKAISANAKMKNAIKRESNAAEAEIIRLTHATTDYGKALTQVQLTEREINSGRYMNASEKHKAQLRETAKAYDLVANSTKNAANAQFKMNEQQKIQLTYQTTDFVTQIASGQSPLIAALQQGGQLKDVMGGIGPMFKAIGSLFTPTVLGLGSVAVAAGAVGYAFYKAKDDLDKFKDAMTLTGGFSGTTYDSLLNLGNALSSKTNASIGNARDLMQQLAASGKFTSTSMEAVGEVVLRFSKIAGVDAVKAAETLIPLLDGTASSAKQLNDKYHFLTLEQYKNIEALERQGKLQEAAKMQATLLNDSLQSTQRQLGILEKSWQSVANFASGAWDAMMGWGRENGTDRAKELETKINQMTVWLEQRQGKLSAVDLKNRESQIQAMKNELNAIVGKEMAALDAAEARAKKAEEEQARIKAYSGAGGAGKAADIQAAIDKANAEVKFRMAMESANEIQKIELEADKKKEEKRIEFSKKSAEEKRAFGGLLAKQESAEILAIELEKQEKIRQVRNKNVLAEYEESVRVEKEITDAAIAEDNRRAALRTDAQNSTRSLEFEKERLELKYQLIYATEKEQKLGMISLEYARKRKEVEGSPEKDFLTEQLNRQEALEKMNVTIQDSIMKTQQVFDTVWGNMGSAIDNFVKTGKFSMKDFARSVIQDLIAIQMKAAAMRFLGAAFGAFSGGGTSMSQFEYASISGYADGGQPPVGVPSLVGERGPELFIPKTAGTIVPNHELNNMGSTTNVTNYNINAIDTKSFEERLLGSSNAIWAANQYAGKNLATSFGRT